MRFLYFLLNIGTEFNLNDLLWAEERQNNVLHLSRFISKVEVQANAAYLLACGGIHPGRVEPASPIELTSMAIFH